MNGSQVVSSSWRIVYFFSTNKMKKRTCTGERLGQSGVLLDHWPTTLNCRSPENFLYGVRQSFAGLRFLVFIHADPFLCYSFSPLLQHLTIFLFSLSSAKVPFFTSKTSLVRKCLCQWSLAYSLEGNEGKFLLRLVSCPHQDFITWPITGRSQWLYVTAEFPENCIHWYQSCPPPLLPQWSWTDLMDSFLWISTVILIIQPLIGLYIDMVV